MIIVGGQDFNGDNNVNKTKSDWKPSLNGHLSMLTISTDPITRTTAIITHFPNLLLCVGDVLGFMAAELGYH